MRTISIPSIAVLTLAIGVPAVAPILPYGPHVLKGQALATVFSDVTAASGVDVVASGGDTDYGSGAAFFDYDNDGDLDLYVVMESGVANKLYRNNGRGTFVDLAATAGVGDTLWGRGVKCADYDNDGDKDMFLANYNGPNRLFRNNGNGTFTDVTDAAGMAHTGPSYGAAWGDYDRDGLLDLYVVNYYSANLLYRNLGNGVFGEEAGILGVQDATRPGFDAVWFDYDNDCDADLYIANDLRTGNVLYRNDGGVFTDVSFASGAGVAMSAMGIALGDYNHDGNMDLYITNTGEGNVLLRNSGDGTFTDEAKTLKLRVNRVGWGTAFFDYDNDGDDDLYVVNSEPGGGTLESENTLFRNDGATFTDVTAESGAGDRGPGFGLALGDYDEDGCMDLFVHNRNAPSVLLKNTPNSNNWLKVKTVGRVSNYDGIGARINVVTGSRSQIKDVSGGMSYLSFHSPVVGFGLGTATTAEVTVHWPSGIMDVIEEVPANQTVTVVEGIGLGEPGTFVDATSRLGIDVAPGGERDDWGHGAAFYDVDGDGQLELYVVMEGGEPNRLFRYTEVSKSYVDIAKSAGCDDALDGRGVVFADYDNDGDPDLFLANDRGPNRLYENDGSGSFADVSVAAGVDYAGRSHSAAWADYNNDGYVDLFVCNYGTNFSDDPNLLYVNNGDGTFTERGAAAGVDEPDTPALAVAWIDYDNDNDVDLYIANDKLAGNSMYRNNGDGTFSDVSQASGTFLEFNAMGIAIADYDHNGYLDMYITNTSEGNALLKNNGDGTFTDVAAAMGVLVNRIGWGTAFLDYDNDGDDDLYLVNWAAGGGTASGNVFFRNDGGTLVDATNLLGVGDQRPAYGLTVGDYNNDGFVDMFVNNQSNDRSARSVFYECVPNSNNWIKIKTVGSFDGVSGSGSNRDGIGAKIRVTTGSLTQIKDVRSGSSYLSQLSPEIEFGLGAASNVDKIEITWPSGIVDEHLNIEPNQFVEVHEGGELELVPLISITLLEVRWTANVGAEIHWTVRSNEIIEGFRVYRREGSSGEILLNSDGLIGPLERTYVDSGVEPGKDYEYALSVVLQDGSEKRSQRVNFTAPVLATSLGQNYPNPFNPSTTIRFTLPATQHVDLAVFDAAGRRVITLINARRPQGEHAVEWDGKKNGRRVGSGVYFYRLQTAGQSLTRKMVVLK